MADPKEVFTDAMPDWQVVDDAGLEAGPTTSDKKCDRVAQEYPELRRNYQGILPAPQARSMARIDPAPLATSAHAEFIRAKKKGFEDGLVDSQTFLVSGSRIIGAQG